MLDRLVHYPWLRARRQDTVFGGLGVVTFETRVAAAVAQSADGRFVAALDGEFYETGPERERLGAAGIAVADADADLLIAGWRHEGDTFLARLNGEFAAVIWDEQERALHVVTDRFGLRSL